MVGGVRSGKGGKFLQQKAGPASKGDMPQIETRYIIFYPTSCQKITTWVELVDATAASPSDHLFKYTCRTSSLTCLRPIAIGENSQNTAILTTSNMG